MNNLYDTPESDLESENRAKMPNYGQKFLVTLAGTFIAFFLLIALVLPKSEWFVGGLGALIFSIVSSVITSFIPLRNKFALVAISIAISFVSAYLVGLTMASNAG